MTAPNSDPERKSDNNSAPPGVPRWVKVSAIVLVILVVVLVVVIVLVGGEHGPGLHTGAGAVPSRTLGSL